MTANNTDWIRLRKFIELSADTANGSVSDRMIVESLIASNSQQEFEDMVHSAAQAESLINKTIYDADGNFRSECKK